MGLENFITDPKTGKKAQVDTREGEAQGLIVSTQELKTLTTTTRFFTSANYGIDMNIGVAFGATPVVAYQENTEWTTSIINGVAADFIFNSAGGGGVTPHAGSVCIDARASGHDNIMQLDRGSDLDLTGYIAISGWINFTQWNDLGTEKSIYFYAWDTNTGLQVGATIHLENYVDPGQLLTWQQFIIPLSDMGLTGETIDAFRIQTRDIGLGNAPDYFLDDIQVEETGAIPPSEFTIEPSLQTWLHVRNINIFIADDDYDSTLANASVPQIPYDTFLGVAALSSGLLYREYHDGEVTWSGAMKQLSDILQLPTALISGQGCTGATKTWVKINIEIIGPLILKSENKDKLSITVSDSLSGLDMFRASCGCEIEERT